MTPVASSKGPLWLKVILTIAVVIIGVSLVLAFVWRLMGGEIYLMTTGSMSPVTPVWSLILDTAPTHLRLGDTITFHPPGTTAIYTHRIAAVLPGHHYRTEGVAIGQFDPWILTPKNIMGKTAYQFWGLGYYWKILPFMAIGTGLLAMAYPYIKNHPRNKIFVGLWGTVLVVVPLMVLRPLISAQIIRETPLPHRNLSVYLTSTGLAPSSVKTVKGLKSTFLPPGHPGTVVGPLIHQHMVMMQTVSLSWWGWAILISLIASPLWTYAISHRPRSMATTPGSV